MGATVVKANNGIMARSRREGRTKLKGIDSHQRVVPANFSAVVVIITS